MYYKRLFKTIIEGKLEGNNIPDQPRKPYMSKVVLDLQCNIYGKLKKLDRANLKSIMPKHNHWINW